MLDYFVSTYLADQEDHRWRSVPENSIPVRVEAVRCESEEVLR